MPAIALLANPGSGQGQAERVEDLLADRGADVERFDIDDWRRAAASGADRIVVAGGDGSLGSAAEAAREASVPLAVVATGTANDFARQLGLPEDIEAACELAVAGTRTRRLELGRAGGRPFVNVASVGLSPAAAEEAHELKDTMGALAYPAGAVKAGATAEPISCTVTCDGSELFRGEARQVSVASSGAFGGGAELEADEADGRLDVVVIEGSGRARLAKHAYGLRAGALEEQKGVRNARCKSAELHLEDGGESLNVDGEVVPASELGDDGTIRFTVEADAFELIVP